MTRSHAGAPAPGRGAPVARVYAAAAVPGEVGDETRGVVYAFATMFLTSVHADQYRAQELIHEAYEIGRRVEGGHPALRFVAALERMLCRRDRSAVRAESAPLTNGRKPAHTPVTSSRVIVVVSAWLSR